MQNPRGSLWELPVLYISTWKIFLCFVEYFSDFASAFQSENNSVNRERFLLAARHRHTHTHRKIFCVMILPSFNYVVMQTNPNFRGLWCLKVLGILFWISYKSKAFTSLRKLVYQGTSFAVLWRMICIYQVCPIFFCHINCLEDPLPN